MAPRAIGGPEHQAGPVILWRQGPIPPLASKSQPSLVQGFKAFIPIWRLQDTTSSTNSPSSPSTLLTTSASGLVGAAPNAAYERRRRRLALASTKPLNLMDPTTMHDSAVGLQAHALDPEYLKNGFMSQVNYKDWQVALGRRFRSLKLWFTMRRFGANGLRTHIRRSIDYTKRAERLLLEDGRFTIFTPVRMALVCFYISFGGRELNEALLRKVNDEGKIFLIHSVVDGVHFLRLSYGGLEADEWHVDHGFQVLTDALTEIVATNAKWQAAPAISMRKGQATSKPWIPSGFFGRRERSISATDLSLYWPHGFECVDLAGPERSDHFLICSRLAQILQSLLLPFNMLGKIVLAAAALASVAVADSRQCTTSEALAVNAIEKTAAAACKTATGFKAVPPTGYPDDTQLKNMCGNADCKTLIAGLKTGWTTDCDFVFPNNPVTNLLKIVTEFDANCARVSGGSTPSPTTPAPTTPSPTTPAPTTPAPTTPEPTKPVPTTATPEPTKPIPTTATPEPTKPVPTTSTPEPTKPAPKPQC